MSDLEGDDMILPVGKRPSAASVAGRRTRETSPLAVADRRLISHRTRQPGRKIELNAFLDVIEKLLRKLGIEIEVGDDQWLYCLDPRLAAAASSARRPLGLLESVS